MKMSHSKKEKIIVTAFFLIYFISGLLIYRDYGVSCDEPAERRHGIVTYTHLASKVETFFFGSYVPEPIDLKNRKIVDPLEIYGIPQLSDYKDRAYGSVYSLSLYTLEAALNISPESAEIFYLRHLINFLLFFLATIFFYKIASDRWKDWKIGLLAAAMLILSPRIFAEAFYNNKDVAFLSIFIIAIYFLINFLKQKTHKSAIIFAVFSALAINIRITAIILPTIGIFFYALNALANKKQQIKKHLLVLSTYLSLLIAAVIILWPYLWPAPLRNFLAAYLEMAHYDPGTEHLNLYFGQIISSQHLPWHYIPVWIIISTPILYSLLFLTGLMSTIIKAGKNIKNKLYFLEFNFELLIASLFLLPLAAIIIFNSWLYDGWRQMYFIHAPFLLLGISGFVTIRNLFLKKYKNKIIKNIPWVAIIIYLIFMAGQIILLHPHQNVYFNKLVGEVNGRFDADYWGSSYRSALEYIVQNDDRLNISISTNSLIGMVNIIVLEIKDRSRITFTTPDKANYILTEFRLQNNCHYQDEIKAFYAGKTKIMGIYPGGQACEPN